MRLSKAISILLVGLIFKLTITSAADAAKPNIVFIMVDDLGKEWISSYGAQDIKTPNIDHLATTGMRFTNAYSMPKCTPTRVALLTGQYPWNNGWANHWDVPRLGGGVHFDTNHYTTFAELVKKQGYRTAIAGKWQINDFRVQPEALKNHGFDEYMVWTGFETLNPPSGKRYWDPYIHTSKGSQTYKGEFGSDLFADFLVDFIHRNKENPMMIYYPMILTHTPFLTTPSSKNAESRIDRFKGMVKHTDLIVGKITHALEKAGIRDNTILIFTTDNGTSDKIEGRRNNRVVQGAKGKLPEPGMNAPFIVSAPGLVPSGVVTDALTDFTDMLPTFAELVGVEVPKNLSVDGVSIASVMLGRSEQSSRQWIAASKDEKVDKRAAKPWLAVDWHSRVVRDKRFKIWANTDRKVVALYDLFKDPAEKNNLIDSKSAQHVAAKKRLSAVLDTMPRKDKKMRFDRLAPQPWDYGTLNPKKK
jgi:arylsulfatase A-like enzyme